MTARSGPGVETYMANLVTGPIRDSSKPRQVKDLSRVAGVAAGAVHTLALKSDGTVWAWGENDWGQLGDGSTANRSVPVQVWGLLRVIAVAAGYSHTVALRNDGTVVAWGNNEYGQVGDGGLSRLSGVLAVAAGFSHTVALKNDGTVWTWGGNGNGQLGYEPPRSDPSRPGCRIFPE